jgi:hypothetical protein
MHILSNFLSESPAGIPKLYFEKQKAKISVKIGRPIGLGVTSEDLIGVWKGGGIWRRPGRKRFKEGYWR